MGADRPPISVGTRWFCVVLAAMGLAVLDFIQHSVAPDIPPIDQMEKVYAEFAPPVSRLIWGAPFHTFSNLASDYFVFVFHWKVLPLLVLTVWWVRRWLNRRFTHDTLFARASQGIVPALILLLGLEFFVVTTAPRFHRFVSHPLRIWALRPNLMTTFAGAAPYTNADGFRPTPPGSENGATVLVLGDSTTFGTGVDRSEQTYCWKLGKMLAKVMPKSSPTVVNRACPGYSTWQGKELLYESLAQYRPRVVIAAFMANDWTWAAQRDSDNDLPGIAGGIRAMLRTCNLYLLTEHLAFGYRDPREKARIPPAQPDQVRVGAAEFEQNLESMRRMCQQVHANLLLLCMPTAREMDVRSRPYRDAEERVGHRTGAEILNVHDEWKRKKYDVKYFQSRDPIHPVPAGHDRIARELTRELRVLLRDRS